MPRIQQWRRPFLKGFSVQWETQTRAVIYKSVISAPPGLYTVLSGSRGCVGHAPQPEGSGRDCLWKSCLEWVSEDEYEWVHGKGEKGCFRGKKHHEKRSIFEDLHLVRYEEKEESAKDWNINPDFIMEVKHFGLHFKTFFWLEGKEWIRTH